MESPQPNGSNQWTANHRGRSTGLISRTVGIEVELSDLLSVRMGFAREYLIEEISSFPVSVRIVHRLISLQRLQSRHGVPLCDGST